MVLAREAGICYATIAMSTDYDCWHQSESSVTWEMIAQVMNKNVENVKTLLFEVIPKIDYSECECKDAIKKANAVQSAASTTSAPFRKDAVAGTRVNCTGQWRSWDG